VLDIILQAFECQPNCNYFITLVKKLSPPSDTICELLGSKLQIPDNYSYSLFVVIAHLLQHNVIKLEQIYPWVLLILQMLNKIFRRGLMVFIILIFSLRRMIELSKDNGTDRSRKRRNMLENRWLWQLTKKISKSKRKLLHQKTWFVNFLQHLRIMSSLKFLDLIHLILVLRQPQILLMRSLDSCWSLGHSRQFNEKTTGVCVRQQQENCPSSYGCPGVFNSSDVHEVRYSACSRSVHFEKSIWYG
jgi:hypothetical protein